MILNRVGARMGMPKNSQKTRIYDEPSWYLQLHYGMIKALRKQFKENPNKDLAESISSLGYKMWLIKRDTDRERIGKELTELKARMGVKAEPRIQFADEPTTD